MSDALNKDYTIGDEIGRGKFGVVYKCTSNATGENFAVKSINKKFLIAAGDTLDAQCLLNEPKILQLLSPHRHVINFFYLYEDDDSLHMVVELCPNHDLHSMIVSSGPLSEPQAKTLFIQLINAILHCHKYGVVHRDIKPENILFDERNCVKLADFGSAEMVADGAAVSGVVGSPYYVAPEVLGGREYGEKVDVWSAGVVLYVMLAGYPPFYGETPAEVFEAVIRGNLRFPPRVFRSVSAAVKDLLRRMLTKEVSRRLSAEQVLRHPWMTSGG